MSFFMRRHYTTVYGSGKISPSFLAPASGHVCLGVFAEGDGLSGSNFSAEKSSTPRHTCTRALFALQYIYIPLILIRKAHHVVAVERVGCLFCIGPSREI